MQIENLDFDYYRKRGEEISQSLASACEWLDELGYDFRRTRYGKYIGQIDSFGADLDVNAPEEDLKAAFHLYLNASFEAVEIIRVKTALDSSKYSDFNDRLKKVVGGDVFRSTSLNDHSRNFLFELSMAARFLEGGYEVNLNHVADIVAVVNGHNLYVECKRIRSVNKVIHNIGKANKQIRKRLASDKSKKSRGLVALNVNDVINPENMMLSLESYSDLQTLNSKCLENLVDSNRQSIGKNSHKRTLGVFFEFTQQALVTEGDELLTMNCRGAKLYQYGDNEADDALIKEMAENISNQNLQLSNKGM